MIRTAALTVLALGAMAAPAFAFETQSAPAPKGGGSAFADSRIFGGMAPTTTSTPFHFGPAEAPAMVPDQPEAKKPMVVYELKGGKPADRIDVTDPRDNPFMSPLPPLSSRSSEIAH
jgi:hypothetical protein